MSSEVIKNIYSNDRKRYEICNNLEFLTWFKNMIKNGYDPVFNIDEMQEMIEYINMWYLIKYPSEELREYPEYPRFKKYDYLSAKMNHKELMLRMPNRSLNVLEANYRSFNKFHDNKMDNKTSEVTITVKCLTDREKDAELLSFNAHTGLLTSESISLFGCDTVEQMASNNNDSFDYTNVRRVVNNHNVDLILRKKLLDLVTLRILYDKRSSLEESYKRTLLFIEEFNEEIHNLNLSDNAIIESITNKEISKRKKEDNRMVKF